MKGISDCWFQNGGFQTFRKPTKEFFEIASDSGTINTLEGPVRYMMGDIIMTGPVGEKYPISPEAFALLKDDCGSGVCSPRKIIKTAKLADHSGIIETSLGDKLAYNADEDFIVLHGPNEYGVVKKEVFLKSYDTQNLKN